MPSVEEAGRQHVPIFCGGNGRLDGAGALEHVINGVAAANVKTQREGEVALGVDVHAQHPGAPLMQPADQGGSHGGFSHAAFLICDGNDL